MNNRFQSLLFLTLLCLAGCQTVPPPTSDVAAAVQRIEQAEEADAETLAPVELQFAREKLAQAEALIAERRFAEALRLIEQSKTDAELAQARSRSAQLRAEVAEKTRANLQLRAELLGGGAP